MKRISQNAVDCADIVKVLSAGGVVAFPTDTCYAFGVDATDELAAQKLFQIKMRPTYKAKIIAFSDREMLKEWIYTDEVWECLAEAFLPGPLTMILRRKKSLASILNPNPPRIATRIINHPVPTAITTALGRPITCTSANKHGMAPLYDPELIFRHFYRDIDLLIDGGVLASVPPSTIIDLESRPPELVRAGPIGINEIFDALHKSGLFTTEELVNHLLAICAKYGRSEA